MPQAFQWKRHVFVVMPFGSKEVPRQPKPEAPPGGNPNCTSETKIQVDFNAVYEKLFAPALKKIGCEPFRADEESGAGDIRQDMFFELITADLVLADISILNANVFYELGIRHGVGPRGVVAVHAGWSDRPFDVAPDRTFRYEGKLFVKGMEAEERWQDRLTAEIDRFAEVLKRLIAEDEQKTGSPVYSHVEGLKPVDFSEIKTDRARYFGAVHQEWQQKLKIARKQQHPGDILTLAEDMPTRLHRKKLLWESARALVALNRFEAARVVLDELLEMDHDNFEAKCFLELVQNRLGFRERAEVKLSALVTERRGDGEAQGMLGRVYKDIWRSTWEKESDPGRRREEALANDILLRNSIESYKAGFIANLDNYFTGINYLSLLRTYIELGGNLDVPVAPPDLQDIAATVRLRCKNDLLANPNDIWALAALGEVAVLEGKAEEARNYYNRASRVPDTSYFEIDSMLTQICLFGSLGFFSAAVAPVFDLLTARAKQLGNPKSQFEKVVVFSGHMIDRPERGEPRFPKEKEEKVRQEIAARLDESEIGAKDLALCGGACGGDILFAEECVKRGAQVRLMIALPLDEFIPASVSFAGSHWVKRLRVLMENTANCEYAFQHERIGTPPAGMNPFSRNNIWEINTARAQSIPPTNLFAILVWDQKRSGDGAGGTSDFANRVQSLGGVVHIINPLTIELK
jgi:tetratricopeptide (TPR) repeat protein